MSGADLLVLIPWVIFAAGVITLIVLAFTRSGPGRAGSRRPRGRQRHR